MHSSRSIPELIARSADAVSSIEEKDISPLIDRIGDSKAVLLGEAAHRQGLIEHKKFKTKKGEPL